MFHINSRLLTQFYHKIFQPDQLTELIIESNRKINKVYQTNTLDVVHLIYNSKIFLEVFLCYKSL